MDKEKRNQLIHEAITLRKFGLTQQAIAERLKVPQPTINRWLNNGYNSHGDLSNTKGIIHIPAFTLPKIKLHLTKYENANIAPESIDLIITDPPYLVSSKDMVRSGRSNLIRDFGQWDKTKLEDYEKLVSLWASLMYKHLKIGGCLYLFISYTQSYLWHTSLSDAGFEFLNHLIWHKTNPAPQIRKVRWCNSTEIILFFSKGPLKTFNWLGQNEMHNLLEGGISQGDERTWHPTQKPRWLLAYLMWVSSLNGDLILNPFAGSGATAFALASLIGGRDIILVEPEPKYIGLIQSTAKDEFSIKVSMNGDFH